MFTLAGRFEIYSIWIRRVSFSESVLVFSGIMAANLQGCPLWTSIGKED